MGLFPKDRDLSQAPEHVRIEVRASDFRLRHDELELRLDAFLRHHLSWRSRTSIQRLIKDGLVSVAAGEPSRPDEPLREEKRPARLLRHGAVVVVRIPEELRLPVLGATQELVILYEDEDLLAVDKPPLLPVHPSGRYLVGTLIQLVHARYAATFEGRPAGDAFRVPVRLCHRLDRETSGVVLIGKNRRAHAKLMNDFEKRRVEKEYLAIVHGVPERACGVVDLPLGPARGSSVHLKIAVRPDGMPSVTEWRVLARRPEHALLACRPRTGRQHQIRVHMEALGYPLVGDKLYGVEEDVFLRYAEGELTDADRARLRLDRHALHNHKLGFRHPTSGEAVEVESPLAADLAALWDELAAP